MAGAAGTGSSKSGSSRRRTSSTVTEVADGGGGEGGNNVERKTTTKNRRVKKMQRNGGSNSSSGRDQRNKPSSWGSSTTAFFSSPRIALHYMRMRMMVFSPSVFAVCGMLLFVLLVLTMQDQHHENSGMILAKEASSGGGRKSNLRGRGNGGNMTPFNDHSMAKRTTHLIMVAGHSVIINPTLIDQADTSEEPWYLLPYQKGRGLPQSIVGHIRAGIVEAARDPAALLVFSGGETRANIGPMNEGSSYYAVADALDLWNAASADGGGGGDADTEEKKKQSEHHAGNESGGGAAAGPSSLRQDKLRVGDDEGGSTVRARTVTEEFATDSFENLLFAICRFHEVTQTYPERITVVSFGFKRERFERHHLNALRYPLSRFTYIGYDPPSSTGFDVDVASAGERENSLLPFAKDPYGCNSPVLQQKRQERNPFARTPPYELTCPEMKTLLHWCGPQLIDKNSVPWSHLV